MVRGDALGRVLARLRLRRRMPAVKRPAGCLTDLSNSGRAPLEAE
jgi:hypothetical protein